MDFTLNTGCSVLPMLDWLVPGSRPGEAGFSEQKWDRARLCNTYTATSIPIAFIKSALSSWRSCTEHSCDWPQDWQHTNNILDLMHIDGF